MVNNKIARNFQDMVGKALSDSRKIPIEFRGMEKLPKNQSLLFLVNHSNSHDYFTMQETFYERRRMMDYRNTSNPLVGGDYLNFLIHAFYDLSGAVRIDRRDKLSCKQGSEILTQKIIDGNDGIVWPEATWNLHPTRPMQPMKAGSINIAANSCNMIVPTIFEYIENNDDSCEKEKDIYSKVIISFANPVEIKKDDDPIKKINEIKEIMSKVRMDLWRENHVHLASLEERPFTDAEISVYLNHTGLKKKPAPTIDFDTLREMNFMLSVPNQEKENDYYLDENKNFKPLR